MADLPAIPVAEFSPAWHQYQVLLKNRLETDNISIEERLAALEQAALIEDQEKQLIRGWRTVTGQSDTSEILTMVLETYAAENVSNKLIFEIFAIFGNGGALHTNTEATNINVELKEDGIVLDTFLVSVTTVGASTSPISGGETGPCIARFIINPSNLSSHIYSVVLTGSNTSYDEWEDGSVFMQELSVT